LRAVIAEDVAVKRILLVTGGVRSGKSSYALAAAEPYARRAFVATAVAIDKEMTRRIRRHQQERKGRFLTVEEPEDLAGALRSLSARTDVAVLDCLTVWLGNLMHCHGAARASFPELAAFLRALKKPPCDLIIVTNEVGFGVVPENAMARAFRDLAGTLNRQVAALATDVVLLVSGIPIFLKQDGKPGAQS
jgi:adenosylcobinamide kinase / adenosylcobinamide-phosphate guanylyltransferase